MFPSQSSTQLPKSKFPITLDSFHGSSLVSIQLASFIPLYRLTVWPAPHLQLYITASVQCFKIFHIGYYNSLLIILKVPVSLLVNSYRAVMMIK